MEYKINSIGIIHSPYQMQKDCPVQGAACPEGQGHVEVFPEYAQALESIELFLHLYLFYIFDRAGEIKLSRPTFLDDAPHGVFASRHPCRPNSLGMSIVKLEKRDGYVLKISEIDVLDNTPLIDIKPYIPKFDYRENAGNGWVEQKGFRNKPAGRE